METLIGVILILAIAISIPIAFGKIGSHIAKGNEANESSGFWFGFWLGPIGLIIAALLKPIQKKEIRETIPLFSGPESLDNDSYKIWLVRTYSIEKNDAIGSFICDDRIFATFDEAIQHAHLIEQEDWPSYDESERENSYSEVSIINAELENSVTSIESPPISMNNYSDATTAWLGRFKRRSFDRKTYFISIVIIVFIVFILAAALSQ